MGNSLDRALGDEEEVEVRASVVIRKKSLGRKDERAVRNLRSGRKRRDDGENGSYRLHDDEKYRVGEVGGDGEEGDGDHEDDNNNDDDDDDDRSQLEEFQLQLMQRLSAETQEEEEEEEGEDARVRVRKRKRRRGGVVDADSRQSLIDRPLSSNSTSSAPPPARKRSRGNSGRPASVTVCSDTDKPSIDIKVTRSHLSPNFTLNLPPGFVRAHISLGMQYRVINGGNCHSLSVHQSGKRFLVKRPEWRSLVEDQELEIDDLVHLEVFGANRVIKVEVFKGSPVSKAIIFDEDSERAEESERQESDEELKQMMYGMVPVSIKKMDLF